MKRMFWLLLAICLPLCACGNHENIETTDNDSVSSVQLESPKGSLENPYLVGEPIVIPEMYPVSGHPASQIPFRMELTVTDAYSSEESASNRLNTQYPVATLTLAVSGAYDGELTLDHIFYRPLLTEEMEKEWPLLFLADNTSQETSVLEVGQEYEMILAVYQQDANIPPSEYPYLMISYYSPDNSTLNDIYIDLSEVFQPEVVEDTPDLSPAEQDHYYQAAAAAEAKGYYAVAKNLYEDIPGYKDANDRLESVLNFFVPYNGSYYGESLQHEGASVWLHIQDGTVHATYDAENSRVLEYELFQYETRSDGSVIMAFGPSLTRFFLDNQNASYTHGYTITQDEDTWSVTATPDSQDCSWNSTLWKVSVTANETFD